MPIGIEVNDASGSRVFDTGNRLYRVLTVRTAGSGGSFTHPDVSTRAEVIVSVQSTSPDLRPPVPTVSGNTVSWNFAGSGGGANDTNATLQIMVF